VQPISPKYKRKRIEARLETPCPRLADMLTHKGGQTYYTGGNSTTGYIIIPPQLVFTEQNIILHV
jgi:hypothetical protein